MKRFSFRFQTLLETRQREEDEALKQLGVAQRARAHEISRKEKIVTAIAKAYARIHSIGDVKAELQGAEAFRVEQDFIAGSKVRSLQADHAILRANRAVDRAMRQFLAARRRTRMIEILRDKDVEEFKKARSKKEARDMDELTILRHGRETPTGGLGRAS